MRIPIANLLPEQIAALPRTTRWRAEKRGWATVNYRARFANMRIAPSPDFEAAVGAVYRQAARIVGARYRSLDWGFASYMDQDDLIQECVIEVWRCSAKPGFSSPAWRATVIINHLRRLRQQCRFDRDKFNQEQICKQVH